MNPLDQTTESYSRLIRWVDRPADEVPKQQRSVYYLLRLLCILIKEFLTNDLSLRSGALTYTIMLSLVPILAFSTAAVKGLADGNHIKDAAYSYIAAFEPSGGEQSPLQDTPLSGEEGETNPAPPAAGTLTAHLHTAVDKLFDYVDSTDFATLGTIGVLGIMASIILVLSHIEAAMNTIWKVKSGRSVLRKIADYLTLLILMPISINVAFAASAFLTTPALAEKMNVMIPFPWGQTLLLKALPVLFITATFHIMYIFFPNTKVKTLPSLAGAFIAASLWFIVQNLYITLQVGVAKYNAIYGSFATLPLFLVWMYLGWMFILIGAQFSYALQNLRSYRLNPVQTSPARQLSAAIDVVEVIYKDFREEIITTNESLKKQLPQYTAEVIEQIVSLLEKHSIIHVSSQDSRLLPAVPEEKFHHADLVAVTMGESSAKGTGGSLTQNALNAAKAAL